MEIYYHEIDDDVLIVDADGGLDAHTAQQLVTDLEKLVDSGLSKIILDCSRLTYVSSAGLAALVRLHKHMQRRGGDVKIAAVKGLDRVLTSGRYVIPMWHSPVSRLAHVKGLSFQEPVAMYGDYIGFLPDVWWFE